MYLRTSNLVVIIIIGITIGWITMGGTGAFMYLTSDTQFCTSCHSMQTPHEEYQNSKHFNNSTGIRAECTDCHIPSDPMGYIVAKTKIFKDIYHEFYTKSLDTKEKYQARKAAMAETVWAQMKANDSAVCRDCHNNDATDVSHQSEDRIKIHNYGIENSLTCIDCHKGVAHFNPAQELDAQAFIRLQEKTKKTSPLAQKVYPIESIPIGKLGTINSTAELTVIKLKNGIRTIELSGYQQKGQEKILYMNKGKRAAIATLTTKGLKQLVTGDYEEDESGNLWRMVHLTTTTDAPLIGSIDAIWDYARELNKVYCSTCHLSVPAANFTVNTWGAITQKMANKTDIVQRDLEILTKFLQNHAKDMVRQ